MPRLSMPYGSVNPVRRASHPTRAHPAPADDRQRAGARGEAEVEPDAQSEYTNSAVEQHLLPSSHPTR